MSALLIAASLAAAHLAAPGGGALVIDLKLADAEVRGTEPVTLVIAQRVTAPLTMSSIEGNWADTEIHLINLGDGWSRVLTGADKVALGGAPGRATFPPARPVAAGEAWTIRVPLYAYIRPLAPGRYRVCISHRYDGPGGGVARSNAAEFSVRP